MLSVFVDCGVVLELEVVAKLLSELDTEFVLVCGVFEDELVVNVLDSSDCLVVGFGVLVVCGVIVSELVIEFSVD
ncbi:MAG: hypothetical protein ACPK7O_08825 [Methanobacterium sp.]